MSEDSGIGNIVATPVIGKKRAAGPVAPAAGQASDKVSIAAPKSDRFDRAEPDADRTSPSSPSPTMRTAIENTAEKISKRPRPKTTTKVATADDGGGAAVANGPKELFNKAEAAQEKSDKAIVDLVENVEQFNKADGRTADKKKPLDIDDTNLEALFADEAKVKKLIDAQSDKDAKRELGEINKNLTDLVAAEAELIPALEGLLALPVNKDAGNKLIKNINDAQKYFDDKGVDPAKGNGPLPDNSVTWLGDDNAAYFKGEGVEGMLFGFDPDTGATYGLADDIVAHEYAHRIVAAEIPEMMLAENKVGETGTVSESLADTFAAAIDAEDWTIGEDVDSLRSMSDPGGHPIGWDGKPMPDHYSEIVRTTKDEGGAHINVGIPNKAAALIGTKLGRDAMADIYLHAMQNNLEATSDLRDLAHATIDSATELYGATSTNTRAVKDAWIAVGLYSEPHPRYWNRHV